MGGTQVLPFSLFHSQSNENLDDNFQQRYRNNYRRNTASNTNDICFRSSMNNHGFLNLRNQRSVGSTDYDVEVNTPFDLMMQLCRASTDMDTTNGVPTRSSSYSRQRRHTDYIYDRSPDSSRCPICLRKFPNIGQLYKHIQNCFNSDVLNYNRDVVQSNMGECSICLEDMDVGSVIARLPCLCIYHKLCLDAWFEVKRCCPSHPDFHVDNENS